MESIFVYYSVYLLNKRKKRKKNETFVFRLFSFKIFLKSIFDSAELLYKIKEIFLLNDWNILFIAIVTLIIIVFSCFSNNSLWEFLLNGWKVKYLFSIIQPALEYFVSIKILLLASTQTFLINNTNFVSGEERKNSYRTSFVKEKPNSLATQSVLC